MDNYGSEQRDKVSTTAEHVLPPFLTYITRKLLLYALLVNIKLTRQLSRLYGFRFEAEISDRDKWKWDLKSRVPLYKARVEKVD